MSSLQREKIATDALDTDQSPEQLANTHRVTPEDILTCCSWEGVSRCDYCETWRRMVDLDGDGLCVGCQ